MHTFFFTQTITIKLQEGQLLIQYNDKTYNVIGMEVGIPNLISRRQFNDRRKFTANLCEQIRKNIALAIDAGEDMFCVDSKPVPVCRIARAKRCKLGKNDFATAPSFGYCASQDCYFFGYKLHALCGLNGVIHSYDMSKANVHDIHYLQDIKHEYSQRTYYPTIY